MVSSGAFVKKKTTARKLNVFKPSNDDSKKNSTLLPGTANSFLIINFFIFIRLIQLTQKRCDVLFLLD